MKAVTVWQPWASLIMDTVPRSELAYTLGYDCVKNVENRTWGHHYRGDILIHAGKRIDQDYMDLVPVGWEPPTGLILGVVNLHWITDRSDSPWAVPGQYHWELRSPRPFLTPIPYKGAQGLFDVPDHVVAKALREIREVSP